MPLAGASKTSGDDAPPALNAEEAQREHMCKLFEAALLELADAPPEDASMLEDSIDKHRNKVLETLPMEEQALLYQALGGTSARADAELATVKEAAARVTGPAAPAANAPSPEDWVVVPPAAQAAGGDDAARQWEDAQWEPWQDKAAGAKGAAAPAAAAEAGAVAADAAAAAGGGGGVEGLLDQVHRLDPGPLAGSP